MNKLSPDIVAEILKYNANDKQIYSLLIDNKALFARFKKVLTRNMIKDAVHKEKLNQLTLLLDVFEPIKIKEEDIEIAKKLHNIIGEKLFRDCNDYDIKFKQISKILMGDNVEEEKKEKREEYLDLENIDISEMIKEIGKGDFENANSIVEGEDIFRDSAVDELLILIMMTNNNSDIINGFLLKRFTSHIDIISIYIIALISSNLKMIKILEESKKFRSQNLNDIIGKIIPKNPKTRIFGLFDKILKNNFRLFDNRSSALTIAVALSGNLDLIKKYDISRNDDFISVFIDKLSLIKYNKKYGCSYKEYLAGAQIMPNMKIIHHIYNNHMHDKNIPIECNTILGSGSLKVVKFVTDNFIKCQNDLEKLLKEAINRKSVKTFNYLIKNISRFASNPRIVYQEISMAAILNLWYYPIKILAKNNALNTQMYFHVNNYSPEYFCNIDSFIRGLKYFRKNKKILISIYGQLKSRITMIATYEIMISVLEKNNIDIGKYKKIIKLTNKLLNIIDNPNKTDNI